MTTITRSGQITQRNRSRLLRFHVMVWLTKSANGSKPFQTIECTSTPPISPGIPQIISAASVNTMQAMPLASRNKAIPITSPRSPFPPTGDNGTDGVVLPLSFSPERVLLVAEIDYSDTLFRASSALSTVWVVMGAAFDALVAAFPPYWSAHQGACCAQPCRQKPPPARRLSLACPELLRQKLHRLIRL